MIKLASSIELVVMSIFLICAAVGDATADETLTISVPQAAEISVMEIPHAMVFSADKSLVYRSSGRGMIELPGFAEDSSLTDTGQAFETLNRLIGGKIDPPSSDSNRVLVVVFAENAGVCTTCEEITEKFLASLKSRLGYDLSVTKIEIDYKAITG